MSAAALLSLLGVGALTGLIGALLGIGGGVFLVPALVLWFDVPIAHAAGAGLIAIIATSCAAASVNIQKGTVNIPLGVVLETSTVLGALTGGLSAAFIPAQFLIGLFGALLAAISVVLWRGKKDGGAEHASPQEGVFPAAYDDPASGKKVSYSVTRIPAGLGVGFCAGNLSGMLGIGGGVIKVPALHLWCGMPMKGAAATSNYMIGVTGAAGAVVYFAQGRLDPTLSGIVAIGVLVGSRGGAALSQKLKDSSIRKAFAVLTVFLAVQMLRRACGG